MKMSIRRFEIERVTVTSSRPFEAVVAALKDAVGRLDLVEFAKASKGGTFAELKEVIDRNPGKTGLMLFMELDHGGVLRKETGRTTPKIVRLVIGNPLVMKEMAKHVPEAGSYAPVTVLGWMSETMAFTCRMTGWPASWRHTATSMLSPSLEIWILKSRTFFNQ
jgi:uncharacterized protein (DUF302 family)